MNSIKMLVKVLVICCLALSVSGCSSNNYDDKIAELEDKIAALEQQVQKLEKETEGFTFDEIANGKWAIAEFDGKEYVAGENTGTLAELIDDCVEKRVVNATSSYILFEYPERVYSFSYIRDGNAIIFTEIVAPILILIK